MTGCKLRLMTLIDEFTRSPPFGASANLTIPCHTGAAVRPRHSQFAIGRGGEFRDIPLQVRPRSTDRTRLRPQSPENGSFSNIRRRLSAILLRNRPNSVSGDPPLIHKSPLFAGFLAFSRVKSLDAGLVGWGGRIRTSVWWNQNQAGPSMKSTRILNNSWDPALKVSIG
jgi:hypothetical protein